MTEKTFINISDRYGDAVPVTVTDYEELNPQAVFEIEGDEIVEYDLETGERVEVVARAQ